MPGMQPMSGATAAPGEWVVWSPSAGVELCQQCGAMPARSFRFGRIVGMLVLFRAERIDIVACRSCALAAGRTFQSRTMALGWWGVIAVFCNLYWIARNAISLRRAQRMPLGVDARGLTLDPGKPVLLRAGAVVSLVFVGAAGWLAWDAKTAPGWKVGSCVNYADATVDVVPVRCSGDHFGKIVAAVKDPADCPITTDGVVEVPGHAKLYCVDEAF